MFFLPALTLFRKESNRINKWNKGRVLKKEKKGSAKFLTDVRVISLSRRGLPSSARLTRSLLAFILVSYSFGAVSQSCLKGLLNGAHPLLPLPFLALLPLPLPLPSVPAGPEGAHRRPHNALISHSSPVRYQPLPVHLGRELVYV